MALNLSALQSGLQSLFSNPPDTEAGCAAQWASAMQSYAAGIVPPSATVSAAATAFQSAISDMSGSGAAASIFESACASFAATVGGGMVGFVPTPPPGPVGFSSLSGHPSTHAAAASAFATLIDTWMKTGLATPPVGAPVPWS